VLTRNFFALLRTTDIDTEIAGVEETVQEQEDPRKLGRPPPIITTSAMNIIIFRSD
jgi:hypothetical protein